MGGTNLSIIKPPPTPLDCGSCPAGSGRAAVESNSALPDFVYLLLLMVVGLALRLDFILPVDSVIDADEAIVGLMARHILAGGEIPTFYYGQHYMGSLEAILTAGAFYLCGESSFTLKLVPLIFSIALVPLVFLLAKQYCGNFGARCAALLTALPPVGLVIWSGKARGGFIEILFIGALALFLAGKLLLRTREGKFNPLFLIGACFALGVGWWVNNQIVFFFLPVGIITLLALKEVDWLALKDRSVSLGLALLAFFIGGAPFWIYNFKNNFVSFEMFGTARSGSIVEHLTGLVTVSLPILIGSKSFWDTHDIFANSSLIFSLIYFLTIGIVAVSALRVRNGESSHQQLSPWILIAFVITTFAIFSFSSFGYLVQAPRYLLPTYVGLFTLVGAGIEKISVSSRLAGLVFAGIIAAQNLVSAYHGERALPGEPMIFNGDRVARDHHPLIQFLQQHNIKLIRTNYWVGYRLAFETQEQIKFVVYQQPRSVRLPEYEQGLSRAEKDLLPLVLSPKQADIVNHGLHAMGYEFNRASIGGYEIFYDVHDKHPGLTPISGRYFSIQTNYRQDTAALAADGNYRTRWGSARPQSPDMFIQLSFREPTLIAGLVLEYDGYETDFARKLEINGYDADGVALPLFSETDYHFSLYAAGGASRIRFIFPPQRLTKVVIRQTGEDEVFDWSISEITPLTR